MRQILGKVVTVWYNKSRSTESTRGCYSLCCHRVTDKTLLIRRVNRSHWCRNSMTVLIKFTETHSYYLYNINHTALPCLVTVHALLYPYLFTKYRYRIDIAIFCQYRIDIVSKLKS